MASGAELAMVLKAKDEASGVFDKVKGSAGGLTSGIGSMIGTLGGIGLAVGGLGMLASGIAGAATSMISGNAQMETYETQLGTMMGSVDAAKERIKQLAQIGAETPFELTQLVAAEKIMMGFGLTSEKTMKLTGKNLDEYRTSMGDMAAGTGTDLSEITNLWAKFGSGATGESLARLQELGIVTKEQLAEVGIQFSKSGELLSPLPEAMAAAMKIADEKFGGGMKALSATFDGQMSTLADNFNQAKTLLMQPIFEVLKTGLTGVNELLSSPAFQSGLTSFAEAGAAAITNLIEVMSGLIGIFEGTDAGIDAIYDGFQGLLSDDAIGNLINIVYSLGETFRSVMEGDIPGAIDGVTQVLSDFGSLIVTLVEDWAAAFVSWIGVAQPDMLDGVADMAQSLMGWLIETAATIIEKLATWAAAFVDWIAPMTPDLLRALGSYAADMVGWLAGTGLPMVMEKLAEWGLAFVEWIAPRIPPMLAALGELLAELGAWAVGTALPAIVAKLLEWGLAFAAWIPGASVAMLGAIVTIEQGIVAWIASALISIVSGLVAWGDAFTAWVAKDVIPGLPGALAQIATSVLGWIGGQVGAFTSAAASLGRAIVDGVVNAIRNGVSAVSSAVMNLISAGLAAGRSDNEVRSPSEKWYRELGRPLADGTALGIRAGTPNVVQAAVAMAEAARQRAMAAGGPIISSVMGAFGQTIGQGLTPTIRQFNPLASGSIIPGLNNTPGGSIPIGPGTVRHEHTVRVGDVEAMRIVTVGRDLETRVYGGNS